MATSDADTTPDVTSDVHLVSERSRCKPPVGLFSLTDHDPSTDFNTHLLERIHCRQLPYEQTFDRLIFHVSRANGLLAHGFEAESSSTRDLMIAQLQRELARMKDEAGPSKAEFMLALEFEKPKSIYDLICGADGQKFLKSYRDKVIARYLKSKHFRSQTAPYILHYLGEMMRLCREDIEQNQQLDENSIYERLGSELPGWEGNLSEPVDFPWWEEIIDGFFAQMINVSPNVPVPDPQPSGTASAEDVPPSNQGA